MLLVVREVVLQLEELVKAKDDQDDSKDQRLEHANVVLVSKEGSVAFALVPRDECSTCEQKHECLNKQDVQDTEPCHHLSVVLSVAPFRFKGPKGIELGVIKFVISE